MPGMFFYCSARPNYNDNVLKYIKIKKIMADSTVVKPKSKWTIGQAIPLVIIGGIFVVIGLSQAGIITLPRIHIGQESVIELPAIPVGVPYSYNFYNDLVPLMDESASGPATAVYTFYLGSGVGFPPMGLILGIDGVLKGTPTSVSTNKFQVCVKDQGGNSICRMFSLNVKAADGSGPADDGNNNNNIHTACPTKSDPPCHSASGGIGVTGVIVPGSCDCPSDTTYAQMDNVTAGGPYKICTCK